MALATYADNDGRNILVSVETLARNLRISARECRSVLDRLEAAGLIIPEAGRRGMPGWRLSMRDFGGESDPLEERARRDRAAHAARNRAYRERQREAIARARVMAEDAIPRDGAQQRPGTADRGARDGLAGHHVTALPPVRDGGATIISAGSGAAPSSTSMTYLQNTYSARAGGGSFGQSDALFEMPEQADAATDKSKILYTEEFEMFWAVYPRRVGKARAAAAWHKARTAGVAAEVIRAGAVRYAQLVAAEAREPRFVKQAEGWLHGRRWEDEVQPLVGAATRGPYRDPDPAEYASVWTR
ncbi:helix-turn-helix domain-containing protein [Actinokineospora bangkokensis]|uniref:helix-turn-helix domain-containing protein n=1 Tax=Actinokineospora bangkokensis TaxID=1193682 RepID=UPI001301347A|nr:helix-turn-helix domain-containing protein [Actinokineospora bangkokensis]